MALLYKVYQATGNADSETSGTVIGGTAVEINDNSRRKAEGLSALVTVDAESDSFTWAGKWQVSNDGTNWVDLANGSQNAAAVVLATGTSGADAAVTKAIPAPEAIYGWRKARFALVTGGATGAAVDTYDIAYCLRKIS